MKKTVRDITPYTDPNWMMLFIKTDGVMPNWEGYPFGMC